MTVRKISQNISKIEFKSPIHKIAKAVAKDLKNSMHDHGKLGFPQSHTRPCKQLVATPVRKVQFMNGTIRGMWRTTATCAAGAIRGKITPSLLL